MGDCGLAKKRWFDAVFGGGERGAFEREVGTEKRIDVDWRRGERFQVGELGYVRMWIWTRHELCYCVNSSGVEG